MRGRWTIGIYSAVLSLSVACATTTGCSDDAPAGTASAIPDGGVTDPGADTGPDIDASVDARADSSTDAGSDGSAEWTQAGVCRPGLNRPGEGPSAPFVVSRSGKYAAFVVCDGADGGKLFVRDLAAGVNRLISSGGNSSGHSYATLIKFSPDESYVAYGSASGYDFVYVRKADGTGNEITVAANVAAGSTTKGARFEWSPDGKYVVAATTSPSLRYASADGTVAPTDIYAGAITTYAFTSNGARLVYQRTGDSSWHSVGLLTNASTALTGLTDLSAVSLVGGTANTVVGKRASDGFLVSVAASTGALTAISTAEIAGFNDYDNTPRAMFAGGTHAIYQNAARNKLHRRNYGGTDGEVTLADPVASNVFMSPDGARFLYAIGTEIRMVPANGSSAPLVVGDRGDATDLVHVYNGDASLFAVLAGSSGLRRGQVLAAGTTTDVEAGTIIRSTIGFTGTNELVWVRDDPGMGFDKAVRVQATAGGPITTLSSGKGDLVMIPGSSKIIAFSNLTSNSDLVGDVSVLEP